jgi:hypothetical protein
MNYELNNRPDWIAIPAPVSGGCCAYPNLLLSSALA